MTWKYDELHGLQRLKVPILVTLGLLILTLVLVVWHHFGMNRVYQLHPNPNLQNEAISDTSSGGESTALRRIEDGSLVLECDIVQAYQWPYCQLDFVLGSRYATSLQGEPFDTIFLDIEYESPRPGEKLRIFVRTYGDYSTQGQINSLMPNQIEYDPGLYPDGLTMPLREFNAASWWLTEMNIPVHRQYSSFNRIPYIQISTGTAVSEGYHRIQINEVSLQGKWLQASTLYIWLLALWVANTLYWLGHYLYMLRGSLAMEKERREGLESLNNVLQLSNQRLEEQASRDELTGLLNRFGLRDRMYDAVAQCDRRNTPLSLIITDIDHFKEINDTWGHPLGDRILQQLGELLSDSVRDPDMAVRWGGEEFLLLCPDTDESQACRLADKLRQAIEDASWPHETAITASFGVAQISGANIADAINRADKALYRAKANGRNRVEMSTGNQQLTR